MEDQFKNALAWITAKANESYKYSLLIVAAGSTLMIYQWVIRTAMDAGAPMWVAGIVAIVAANVWYQAIEHTLKVVMPFAWAYKLTKGDKDKAGLLSSGMKLAGKSAIWVTVLLSVATILLSVIVNLEIADEMTTEQSSEREQEASNKFSETYDASRATLESAVADGKATDAKALKDAEAQAALFIENAANSKGDVMYNLWKAQKDPNKKGYNLWVRKEAQLGKALRIAREKGEKILAAARASNQYAKANESLLAYISTSSVARDSVSLITAGIVSSRRSQYLNRIDRKNHLLFIAVIAAFLVAVFSCRLMVIGRLERNEELIDDESPGIVATAKKMAAAGNKHLAKILNDKWDVDFQSKIPSGRPVVAFATTAKPVSSSVSKPSVLISKPVLAPSRPPTKPVSSPAAAPGLGSSDLVSVSWSKDDRSVLVEINGKTYTAIQAQDRVRKWYDRWKTAAKTRTANGNRQKYEAAKTAMLPYFNFTERKKSVSIKLK